MRCKKLFHKMIAAVLTVSVLTGSPTGSIYLQEAVKAEDTLPEEEAAEKTEDQEEIPAAAPDKDLPELPENTGEAADGVTNEGEEQIPSETPAPVPDEGHLEPPGDNTEEASGEPSEEPPEETEDKPSSANIPEDGGGEAAEEESEPGEHVLEAVTGSVTIKVSRRDGAAFPEGTALNVLSLDDLVSEEENPEETRELYLEMLRNSAASPYAGRYLEEHQEMEWTQELEDKIAAAYPEAIKSLELYQIDIVNADSSLYMTGSDAVEISFETAAPDMFDSVKNGTSKMDIVAYGNSLEAALLPEEAVTTGIAEDQGLVIVTADCDTMSSMYGVLQLDAGWVYKVPEDDKGDFSLNIDGVDVICTCDAKEEEEPWLHDWDCDILKAQAKAECTCEYRTEDLDILFHDETCSARKEAIRKKCTCGRSEDVIADHDVTCKVYKHWMKVLTEEISLYANYNDFMNEGTRISGSVGQTRAGFLLVQNYSDAFLNHPAYIGLKRYSDSTITPFNYGATDVKYVTQDTRGAFITSGSGADGKIGFRVTHVAKKKNRWINATLTLAKTGSAIYSHDDTKVTVHPVFGMVLSGTNRLGIETAGAQMAVRIDMYYEDNGAAATGNYAFKITGVNAGQRFGLSTAGLVRKYALYNCTSYGEDFNPGTGWGTYAMLNAPNSIDSAQYSASDGGSGYFEYDNISSITYYIGPSGDHGGAGNNRPGHRTDTATLKARAELWKNVAAGKASFGDMISSTISGSPYGAQSPSISKYVSKDPYDLATEKLRLDSSTDSFYYNIGLFMPGLDDIAKGYRALSIQDVLPAGIDCTGFSVYRTDTGQDYSGNFTYSNSGDNVTVTSNAWFVGEIGNYDAEYIVRLHCKMDPTEVFPSYNGDSYTYSMDNTASLSVTITNVNGAALPQTYWSNRVNVNYSGVKKHVTSLQKYVAKTTDYYWSNDIILDSKDGEYNYNLAADVPANEYGGYLEQFRINDTLPAGAAFRDASVDIWNNGGNITSNGWFSVNVSGKEITITATKAALNSPGFYGRHYDFVVHAMMASSELNPSRYEGNEAIYCTDNRFHITCRNKGDTGAVTIDSNKVSVAAKEMRADPDAPVKKIVDGNAEKDVTEYHDRRFSTTFSVEQEIPAYGKAWQLDSFRIDDTLEECFELNAARVYLEDSRIASFTGTGESAGWSLEVSGQDVTLSAGSGLSENCYGNTVRLELDVTLKEGYDLSGWYKTDSSAGTIITEIPNTASTTFDWGSRGTPAKITRDTNETKVRIYEEMAVVTVKKSNAVTGESIPDAEFTIYQKSGNGWDETCKAVYSKETGFYRSAGYIYKTAENEGRFKIVETVTPQGYVGSWEKEFTLSGKEGYCQELNYEAVNDMAKGKITVKKTSDSGRALSGAIYEIKAAEDILSPEGQTVVKAGAAVDTVTTSKGGTAASKELYLGKYTVTEVMPPQGYTLNKMPQTVEIVYKDKTLGGSEETIAFTNKETRLYLKKVSELAEGEKEKLSLAGVQFRVWNKDTGSEEDGAVFRTDSNGLIKIQGYIPGTYCYKEISTPDGYAADPTVHEFEIDDEGFVEGKYGHVIEVENKFIKAEFAKRDKATGKIVTGARLQLRDESGSVVDTWTSGAAPHRINRILKGTYTLTELTAPSGYKKNARAVKCVIGAVSQVQSFEIADVKYVDIAITKTIHVDEIVWSHGNPTFTFCVSGTDLDGDAHTYYDTVEFTEDNTPASGDASLTVTFTVPAGTYTATEQKTQRYALEGIRNVRNGTPKGDQAVFDLSGNQNGAAEFINRKITDAGITDTDFVRNVIVPEN